jgi:hypothetical protein
MTKITPETLGNEGFTLVHRGNVSYFEKGEIRVIYVDVNWHLCDIDGNIGNTYLLSIEQIYEEVSR